MKRVGVTGERKGLWWFTLRAARELQEHVGTFRVSSRGVLSSSGSLPVACGKPLGDLERSWRDSFRFLRGLLDLQ